MDSGSCLAPSVEKAKPFPAWGFFGGVQLVLLSGTPSGPSRSGRCDGLGDIPCASWPTPILPWVRRLRRSHTQLRAPQPICCALRGRSRPGLAGAAISAVAVRLDSPQAAWVLAAPVD